MVDKTQTALVRRYDFEDADGQTLSVCLRRAADFVEQYEGGIMDMTLTRDADGPVVSLFTDDLPDTEGALLQQADATEALLFHVAQRLEGQPDMRERVLAQRQRLVTATLLAREARTGGSPLVVSDQESGRHRMLARHVLTLAALGGMPDSFWETDRRVRLACQVLGVTWAEGREWARTEVEK